MARDQNLAYDTMLFFWRIVTNIFFREIRPRGSFNIPRDGAVIFVAAPHHNQFLDPLLLMSEAYREAHRRVQFLSAAKSLKRRVIGPLISLMSSIPVVRAEDEAKPGAGHIYLSDSDPCVVQGVNTRFKTDIGARTRLLLPRSTGPASAEVLNVVSDTELTLKKEFGGENSKGTSKVREKTVEARLAGQPGLTYKILPHVDQQEMYGHVYRTLKEGGCVGIFPEGGSHDRADLLPLKAGVAMMGLGAMAADPNVRVRIVPVGLSYFHAHKFRSRAVVEFGRALDIPPDLVDMFREGGDKKRTASGKLLEIIFDALKTVTVRAPDYETLMLVQAGRRLYKTPGQHLTLGQVVELNKRFIEGYLHFQNEPKIKELREKVLRYNRLVRDLGLRDHQVPRAKRAGWKTLGLLVYRVGLLTAWSILALPGVVLNGPIFALAKIISSLKAKEALAASSVKIAGRDVLATWKVLISLVVTPFLYSFYALVATVIAIKANAPLRWRIWTPFLVMLALPCIGYAALKFGEAGMDVLKSLRPLIVSLIPGQQKELDKLKTMRVQLSNELTEIINLYGPQLYDDFDRWRILVPSAQVPPSTGAPGLWRRKSGTGAVDQQGNLLVHPMSWLDERLFGWSRSSRRGTSAWAGPSSQEPSRHVTPDASDDEDHGDYEDVLGYLKEYEGSRPRSTRSSYADLQQLRNGSGELRRTPLHPGYQRRAGPGGLQLHSPTSMTEISPTSPASPGSPSIRTSPRERRMSLTDQIQVTRIGMVDPLDSFKDATEDLNRETASLKREKSM